MPLGFLCAIFIRNDFMFSPLFYDQSIHSILMLLTMVKLVSFFHPEKIDDSQIGEEDFMEVFRSQKDFLIKINDGIKVLEKKFEEFASQIGDATVEHLIKALEDVVRDFNKKIEEQFGDNFKIFNNSSKLSDVFSFL